MHGDEGFDGVSGGPSGWRRKKLAFEQMVNVAMMMLISYWKKKEGVVLANRDGSLPEGLLMLNR